MSPLLKNPRDSGALKLVAEQYCAQLLEPKHPTDGKVLKLFPELPCPQTATAVVNGCGWAETNTEKNKRKTQNKTCCISNRSQLNGTTMCNTHKGPIKVVFEFCFRELGGKKGRKEAFQNAVPTIRSKTKEVERRWVALKGVVPAAAMSPAMAELMKVCDAVVKSSLVPYSPTEPMRLSPSWSKHCPLYGPYLSCIGMGSTTRVCKALGKVSESSRN